ncbi:hypothetical protein WA577_004135 [Blastocystis sp. JDR]
MPTKDRIAYFYHGDMGNYYYGPGHPMKPQRLRLTHNLLLTYNLYRHLEVYKPRKASMTELEEFHSEDYMSFLQKINPGIIDQYKDQLATYALYNDDNPVFEGIFDFCQLYCGASLDAAARINLGLNPVCINWSGGLHHAKKAEASGFCYANDIVLAILELLKVHPRVMYIDIDIHHGDGVEEAFYLTNRVMTVSFHKYGNYFPGTGYLTDIGLEKGKNYAVNVPLKSGMTDDSYEYVFQPIIRKCIEVFQPSAIAMCCGADSVTGDRLGCFNLTLRGHAKCIQFVRSFNIPMLVLGGGGYTIKNVSRAWSYETSVLLEQPLDNDIPYNSFIEWYAPTYRLHLDPSPSLENKNTTESLDELIRATTERLRSIEAAPSVPMQAIPKIWGSGQEEEEEDAEKREDKQCLDATRRSENDFYDDPKDIDHGDEDKWGVCYKQGIVSPSGEYCYRSG